MHSIIDVHHHWMPPHHAQNLHRVAQPGQTVRELRAGTMGIFRGDSMLFWCNQQISSVDLLMANLDRTGISCAVISVSNWIEWLDLKMCREVNDAMYELKRRFPERIVTLAHVPIGEAGALDELERCVSLGVSGVFSIVHLPRLAGRSTILGSTPSMNASTRSGCRLLPIRHASRSNMLRPHRMNVCRCRTTISSPAMVDRTTRPWPYCAFCCLTYSIAFQDCGSSFPTLAGALV